MGKVMIQSYTTTRPVSLIGEEAGICWGADTDNQEKNYRRGMDCLESGHGRTFEFPEVYMILEGYSARVIREFYTHIGGSPTRLQASTRYINYQKGFDFVIPPTVKKNEEALQVYTELMAEVTQKLQQLDALGIPKEDSAMGLPLGMTTKIVVKMNARTLMDMSRQRMCTRAYWEYRQLFADLIQSLKDYSAEWDWLVSRYFMPKCEAFGYCTEKKSCGRKPKKGECQ